MEIAVLDAEPVIPIAVRVVATDVVQVVADFVVVVVPVDAVVVPVMVVHALAVVAEEFTIHVLIAQVPAVDHVKTLVDPVLVDLGIVLQHVTTPVQANVMKNAPIYVEAIVAQHVADV